MLTQEQLKHELNYDPNTGIFTRLVPKSSAKIGDVAGKITTGGYRQIRLNGTPYAAHRLAYLYMEGYFPEQDIDHKFGNRDDNRWSKLRIVSKVCNGQNRKINKNNRSGCTGVRLVRRDGRWCANAKLNGNSVALGCYDSKLEAALARFTFENECPLWSCNARSKIINFIRTMFPEFNPMLEERDII